jgi:hypothetical protein
MITTPMITKTSDTINPMRNRSMVEVATFFKVSFGRRKRKDSRASFDSVNLDIHLVNQNTCV